MSNPTDWLQIYHQNLSNQNLRPPFNGVSASVPPSDATVVTTTTISDASVSQLASARLSPDQGRVSKPLRRRSRASRRTLTTLLNTDTSNFRAMVQQFTGGPSASFALSSASAPSNMSFGFGQARHPVNPSLITVPPEIQILAHRNLFPPQNQQQQFPFTLNNNNQLNHSAPSYAFPPTLDGSRPANSMDQFGGTSVDGVSPESANGGRGIISFFEGGGKGDVRWERGNHDRPVIRQGSEVDGSGRVASIQIKSYPARIEPTANNSYSYVARLDRRGGKPSIGFSSVIKSREKSLKKPQMSQPRVKFV